MTIPSPEFARLAPPPGTRVLLMGGAGGIGRALCRAAIAQGLAVANVDLQRSLDQSPAFAGVYDFAADATDDASLERGLMQAVDRLGGIDAFVHLAGFAVPPTPATELSVSDWDAMLAVNLRSAFTASRLLMPRLAASPRGAAVFIASSLGVLVERGFSAYSASKAGLIALAKVLAKEHAPKVRVNAVAPGAVETAFLSGGTGRGGEQGAPGWFHNALGPQVINSTIPMGRIADPDDVVGPVLFLLGDAARYMTGQTLFVNGGRHMP